MDYINGIPAFTGLNESISDVVAYSQQLREYLLGGDWVNLSSHIVSPFGGLMEGLMIGRDVELRGNISGSFPAGSSDFADFGPGSPWAPAGRPAFGDGFTSGSNPCTAFIRTNGTVAMAHQTGASRSGVQFTIRFFRG